MLLKCQAEKKLTLSESFVVDFINKNTETVANMSISKIAEQAFVSQATVSRALRKCGVEKMSDIRYMVAKNRQIASNVLKEIRKECVDTLEHIDEATVLEIVKLIQESKTIHLCANGMARFVQEELEFYLKAHKIDVRKVDFLILSRDIKRIKNEDLIIVLTIEDEEEELANNIAKLKLDDKKIVTFCCKSGIKLEEMSDYTLTAHTHTILQEQSGDVGSCLGLRVLVREVAEYLSFQY